MDSIALSIEIINFHYSFYENQTAETILYNRFFAFYNEVR